MARWVIESPQATTLLNGNRATELARAGAAPDGVAHGGCRELVGAARAFDGRAGLQGWRRPLCQDVSRVPQAKPS